VIVHQSNEQPGKVSLKLKALTFISLLILAIGAILSWYFLRQTRGVLMGELQTRALSLTKNLAYNNKYGVLTEDGEILRQLITGILQEDSVLFVLITDVQGKVLVRAFKDTTPSPSPSPQSLLSMTMQPAAAFAPYVVTPSVHYYMIDAVATVQPLVEKNGNILEAGCATDLGAMHADLTKVRQCLFNLLSNACKFTEQGTITLDVAREAVDGTAGVRFRVTDTGIGMTPEQVGRLFQTFAQADASTTRKYGGTGLELAISRHFCQLMEGDIAVESTLGQGSTFTIWLPADVSTQKGAYSREELLREVRDLVTARVRPGQTETEEETIR
jgi:signal transduction histidine kinase